MLYHGTTVTVLPMLQRVGIAPRAVTKGKDNWKHTVTSNRNAVYLTTAYPWHFAAHASKDQVGLILEIERAYLLPWLLCPDEDWMEQASREVGPNDKNPNLAPIDKSMKERTMYYRRIARHNPKLADKSLEMMGTCAYYGTIPWDAVTRYVTIDWRTIHPSMHLRAVDSMVSILNHQILSQRHQALTRWFFGDPVTPQELNGNDDFIRQLQEEDPGHKNLQLMLKQNEATATIMQLRDGLNVVTLRTAAVA